MGWLVSRGIASGEPCPECGREQGHRAMVSLCLCPPWSSPGPARTPEQRPQSLMCCLELAAAPGALCKVTILHSTHFVTPGPGAAFWAVTQAGESEPGQSLPGHWEAEEVRRPQKGPLGSLGMEGNSSCLM